MANFLRRFISIVELFDLFISSSQYLQPFSAILKYATRIFSFLPTYLLRTGMED